MKRKDYKEVSPEPKDYGGSDYSDDRNPISWAAAGRDDNDLYNWDEQPKERTPEGPNAATMEVATTMVMMEETMAMMTLSDCIRCVMRLAVTPYRISMLWSMNVSKPWRRSSSVWRIWSA
jgi:hypothetical protein